MIKLIIGFERQPTMSRAQCQDHLKNSHGPLVKSVGEFVRHLPHYVQNFAVDTGSANKGTDFDGDAVAELWFETPETFATAFSEPRYIELIRPDELRFANPEKLLICACAEEATQWDDGDAGSLKFFRFLVPAGETAAAKGDYAALVGGSTALRKHIRKYVRNRPAPDVKQAFPSERPVTEVEELWLSDDIAIADFLHLERSVLENDLKFRSAFDIGRSVVIVCSENIVIPAQ